MPQEFPSDKTLIDINNEKTAYKDFVSHLKTVQRRYYNKPTSVVKLIENEYKTFVENTILTYRKNHLEEEDEEFAEILGEYRDGLLLFELMEQEIWNKAAQDSTGLKAYYEANIDKYISRERADVFIASTPIRIKADKIEEMLSDGKSSDSIKSQFVEKENIIFTSGIFDTTDERFPENMDFKLEPVQLIEHNESFHVIRINEVLPPKIRPIEDVKGAVINDYQNKIEKQWLNTLKKRFEVKVDKEVFQSLK